MTKAEQEHIAEINRLKSAIEKTQSKYLKKDYAKRIKRMESELAEYRRFMNKGE